MVQLLLLLKPDFCNLFTWQIDMNMIQFDISLVYWASIMRDETRSIDKRDVSCYGLILATANKLISLICKLLLIAGVNHKPRLKTIIWSGSTKTAAITIPMAGVNDKPRL